MDRLALVALDAADFEGVLVLRCERDAAVVAAGQLLVFFRLPDESVDAVLVGPQRFAVFYGTSEEDGSGDPSRGAVPDFVSVVGV